MKWIFALACAASTSIFSRHIFIAAEESCPGGSINDAGQCINPSFYEDESSSDDDSLDESSGDSSDDGEDYNVFNGNPNAHVDESTDPSENRANCNEYLDMRGLKDFQETSSFFQEMSWSEKFRGEGNLDVCMTLDGIVQICSSYRPNYHEPFVHFPAAYLKEFTRVAFIGGGDSMLLHEALKYPSVELVLGLELDQKNVRESLRHFHTQPHFDDARVQWWFGDAAKSLALLPREWFGTFDLVMVDLSETGMSISVNDDLDIFSALALLLKPDGIMVKNEDYFSQLSKYFDHSVSVYMDDYPILCDQDWAMGSNGVDFLHPKLINGLVGEYGVKTLEYFPADHYRMIIDYAHNDARKQGLCDDYDDEALNGKKPQGIKPTATEAYGILLVAEADTDNDATKTLELDKKFKKALRALGMTPLDSGLSLPSGEGMTPSLFIGLEEGYVAAHSYPRQSSIGLEILLWSKLGKQNDILLSLLGLIGADKSYSSYRVIHGGMNGHKNWEEEANMIGPVKANLRNCTKASATDYKEKDGVVTGDLFNTVVHESMSLLTKKGDKIVAVLCGVKGVHDCSILNFLRNENHPLINHLVAIWSCTDTHHQKNQEEVDEKVSHIQACGDSISRSAKAEEGYSALIVDPSAPESMLEQAEVDFCKGKVKGRPQMLRNQALLITSLSSDAERNMFSRCNRRMSKAHTRSGTIVLDTLEIGIIVSANDAFVRKLVLITENVQKKTGVSTEIDRMKSGPVPFQNPFDPVFHSAHAYNQLEAMKQYTHQTPLASQSIYQLKVGDQLGMERSVTKNLLDSVIEKSDHFASSSRVYHEVGNGSVAAALQVSGHIIITWNGASILTINILTEGENYGKQHQVEGLVHMVLLDHDEMIEIMKSQLHPSTAVSSREHMPRGTNRVVNFKHDMEVTSGCADHYELCKDFAQDGECDEMHHDEQKHHRWMLKFCAMSCDALCDDK